MDYLLVSMDISHLLKCSFSQCKFHAQVILVGEVLKGYKKLFTHSYRHIDNNMISTFKYISRVVEN